MSKKDFLLEIGLEEMPARFVTDSMNQLSSKLNSWLTENNLPFEKVITFSTPRRLAVLVEGLAVSQADVHEEAKGPARKIAQDDSGNWSKAAIGFCRGQGATVEDIYFKEVSGVEYVHVKKFIQGQETKVLLQQVEKIVTSLSFPKNMRWANEEMKYIRPIKWIVALFGTEIIPFSVAGVQTGNITKGHRFLGQESVLEEGSKYKETMLSQYVVADPLERKEAIRSQLERMEEEQGWVIPVDEDLLEEINNLVEYPTALFGSFDEEFLGIPEEVLITSMKEHQRYFPVKSAEGKLLPNFVTVRNGDHNHLETVAKGNEKVLRARLADAAFFYREDQKAEISSLQSKLQSIVYHENIGTLSAKVERVRRLTNRMAEALNFSAEDRENADRSAEICKFDLVTNMVYEFPELQGYMGEKYALQKGEKEAVAVAINEHYMPRNADDTFAQSNAGAVLAIAEKLDTIASFMAIGISASGSQDPYALRRQAAGIVTTLSGKNWTLSLNDLIDMAIDEINQDGFAKVEAHELKKEIQSFFKLRLKYLLQEHGIRYDIIEAVLATDLKSVPGLFKKAEVLESNKDLPNFKESMEALSRVLNIAGKAEEISEVKQELFENEYELKLYKKFVSLSKELNESSPAEYFNLLISAKPEIDDYFNHTMVMAENMELRKNRLNLMAALGELIARFAKMSEILVK